LSHYLENVAKLTQNGGFLGCFSLLPTMDEVTKFKEVYVASQPFNSIVNSSITSAVDGNFGDYHSPYTNSRTRGSKLYISPLMSMYFAFDLSKLAGMILYLDQLHHTKSMSEIRTIINDFRDKLKSQYKLRQIHKIGH